MSLKTAINSNWGIISQLAKIANETGAVNLSNDNSDFPCQPELLDALTKHLKDGHNKYAPLEGTTELRSVVASHYRSRYNSDIDPNTDVTITAGATQAIYAAITTLVKEGDEVIVIEPAYQNYVPTILAAGARPIYYQLKGSDFSIDWCTLPKLINGRTRLIIINSPHNPTGMVLSDDDIEQLQRIVNGTPISILSDEAFGELVYDGQPKFSLSSYPKLKERTIIVGSLGKTLCVPGWKIGFLIAPTEISLKIRETHRFQVSSVNLPIQLALADYLKDSKQWFPYPNEMENCRNLFAKGMEGSRFTVFPVLGTYFQILGYEQISGEKDLDFIEYLATKVGVTALPLSLFYHDGTDNQMIRVCFGKSTEDITLATQRLKAL